MTDIRKKILKKINQGGSMMVEAMAMLALIALVTPTLYKKSAERTTELQDINTASHIRTLSKAVDNYVATNYQALLHPTEGLLPADGTTAGITLDTLAPYLPYGYSFDELKNFGTPTVSVRRTADSVTSFVHLPRKTDIGQMRAARIASMVGSNGGYVNTDGEAKGVGGVWSLDSSGLNHLGFAASQPGSIVVASSEAINSATSGALENEKYLQRTPVDNEADLWRNTMTTDLYMGGLPGDGDTSVMHQILGVEKMIIGATENPEGVNANGLVIADEKSAWIGGALSVLDESFLIKRGMNSTAQLDFFGKERKLIHASEMFSNSPLVQFIIKEDGSTPAVKFTDKQAALNIDDFTVGSDDDAYIIDADNAGVDIHKGKVKIRDEYTSANHKLYVGMEESEKVAKTPWLSKADNTLEVSGNAYVTDNLEVKNKVASGAVDTGTLRAGAHTSDAVYEGTNATDWWLTANGSGVVVKDKAVTNNVRMNINENETQLYGVGQDSKVDLGATNAILQGGDAVDIYTKGVQGSTESVNIYTSDANNSRGNVYIQKGAITATGQYSGDITDTTNTVDINADVAEVYAEDFKVHGLDTTTDDNKVREILAINGGAGGSTSIKVNEKDLFRVDNVADGTANVEIDEAQFLVSYKGTKTTEGAEGTEGTEGTPFAEPILKVDYSSDGQDRGKDASGIPTRYEKDGSVYIRRGAIEIENIQGETKYDANDGMGYVEASRFVSNAWDGETDGGIATPVYSGDYGKDVYYGGETNSARADTDGIPTGTGYDRYMVNPAYTSVMHDIKLTTRGGSRLSDILPDFINKGIYVVTNTYPDNININNITAKVVGGSVLPVKSESSNEALEEIETSQLVSGEDSWASPFMGVVPAPQCPPGHSKVITVTPAGFQMAQATNKFVWTEYANNPIGDASGRYVLYPGTDNVKDLAADDGAVVEMYDVGYKQANSKVSVNGQDYQHASDEYFLGYTPDNSPGNTKVAPPTPLTFQQSTWLKSKAIPQANGVLGNCQEQDRCGADFVGWSAIMGFIYPGNHYLKVIKMLKGGNVTEEPDGTDIEDNYYWNIFPVQTGTMEAYATVYCYFDRTNMHDSGIDGKYVDQYDQLNNFRTGYDKTYDKTNANANAKDFQDGEVNNNNAYINRLDDPTLKYNDPW